jgi:hypothetical protein
MPVNFSDARLKLQRGREHIADLEARIARFHNTDFYRLRLEPVQGQARMKVILDSLHEPDKAINAVIGDAIGNLRSALDYIAVAVVAPITNSPEDVGFPFADNDKAFAGQVTSKKSFMAVPVITGLFIDEIQAYKGGKGHTLWVLNKLRNIDKHRFLVTANQMAGIVVSMQTGGLVINRVKFNIAAGHKATIIDLPPGFIKFTDQPKATFDVIVHEPPYIHGEAVIGFLKSAAGKVESILNPLEVLLA